MIKKCIISVVVVAYNEEKFIGKCLDSIFNQNIDRDSFEVLVVDNGSIDRTKDIANRYPLKLIDCPEGKIGKVRNEGVKNSRGDVIAFLDADCEARPNWIRNGVEQLKTDLKIGAVAGRCLAPSDGSFVQWVWAPRDGNEYSRRANHLATGSCFIWRELIESVGFFDEYIETGEDTKLTVSIKKLGKELLVFHGCDVVHHGYPDTSKKFLFRQIKQGSSYLKANQGTFDLTLASVCLFALGEIGIIVGGFYNTLVFLVSICLVFGIPFGYAIFRGYVIRKDLKLVHAPACFFVNFLYFLGRSMGLVYAVFSGIKIFVKIKNDN
jgi:glycosyltransferase involved in cell wall biosynthesis